MNEKLQQALEYCESIKQECNVVIEREQKNLDNFYEELLDLELEFKNITKKIENSNARIEEYNSYIQQETKILESFQSKLENLQEEIHYIQTKMKRSDSIISRYTEDLVDIRNREQEIMRRFEDLNND